MTCLTPRTPTPTIRCSRTIVARGLANRERPSNDRPNDPPAAQPSLAQEPVVGRDRAVTRRYQAPCAPQRSGCRVAPVLRRHARALRRAPPAQRPAHRSSPTSDCAPHARSPTDTSDAYIGRERETFNRQALRTTQTPDRTTKLGVGGHDQPRTLLAGRLPARRRTTLAGATGVRPRRHCAHHDPFRSTGHRTGTRPPEHPPTATRPPRADTVSSGTEALLRCNRPGECYRTRPATISRSERSLSSISRQHQVPGTRSGRQTVAARTLAHLDHPLIPHKPHQTVRHGARRAPQRPPDPRWPMRGATRLLLQVRQHQPIQLAAA
jgi:hypothetical protein